MVESPEVVVEREKSVRKKKVPYHCVMTTNVDFGVFSDLRGSSVSPCVLGSYANLFSWDPVEIQPGFILV